MEMLAYTLSDEPIRDEYARPWGRLSVVQERYSARSGLMHRPFPDEMTAAGNLSDRALTSAVNAPPERIAWAKSICKPAHVIVGVEGKRLTIASNATILTERSGYYVKPGEPANDINPLLDEEERSVLVWDTYNDLYKALMKADAVPRIYSRKITLQNWKARIFGWNMSAGLLAMGIGDVEASKPATAAFFAGMGFVMLQATGTFTRRNRRMMPNVSSGTREEVHEAAQVLAAQAALDVSHVLRLQHTNPFN